MIEAAFYGEKGGAALRNLGGSFYDFEATAFEGVTRRVLASPPDDWGGRAAQPGLKPWRKGSDTTLRSSGWWRWPGPWTGSTLPRPEA